MSGLPETDRGGEYFRVCEPTWKDCADTSYAKNYGGRWNPAGEFGALYLNEAIHVAAANARRAHVGRAIGLFDLRVEERPDLATFVVPKLRVVDAVSADGVRRLRLPASYAVGSEWPRCQMIARRAYKAHLGGVASRSAALARTTKVAGEELAVFDTCVLNATSRVPFTQWYPDVAPT